MQGLAESRLLLSFIFATFALGGIIKGVIGLGLPTSTVGLLSGIMPAQAVAVLIVPSLATNVWQSAGSHFRKIVRRLWIMMLGIWVGTLATAGILTGGSSDIAVLALGVTLIIYAVFDLTGFRLAIPANGGSLSWSATPPGWWQAKPASASSLPSPTFRRSN